MSELGNQFVVQYGPAIMQMLVEGLILPLLGFAIAWIMHKTNSSKAKEAVGNAEETIEKCVQAANQDIVDGIKGTNAWTKEKQDEIFATVVSDVLTILAEDGLKALNKYTGDGLLWINKTVLEYVRIYKKR